MTGESRSPGRRDSRSGARLTVMNTLFLAIFPGVVGLVMPWVIYRLSPASLMFDIGAMRFLGLATAVVAIAAYGAAMIAQMRSGGTPSPIMETETLLTRGAYRFSRNPMYVAGVLFFFGLAAFLQSWGVVFYACLVAFVYYPILVYFEERSMRARFGADYEDYCAHTPRWIGLMRSGGARERS